MTTQTLSDPTTCTHTWKKFVQHIKRERTPRQERRTANPTEVSLSATFTVMGCEKCHSKQYIDYEVHR